MKQSLHPQFHPTATITCSCGVQMVTGSTAQSLTTEICSTCHPFYSGKQNLVDTAGRVEKFKKRLEVTAEKKASSPGTKKPRKTRSDN